MSGPKCGELSFELPLLSTSYDQLVDSVQSTSSAIYDTAYELNQKRKQYIIDSQIAKLKLKIHSQLTYLEELNSSADNLGDDQSYDSIVEVPAFSEMTTPKEFEEGLADLDQLILKYRSHIAKFFEKKVLEEKSDLNDLSQIASDDATPFVTASAIINSIENESTFAVKKKDINVIGQYGEKIQELFSVTTQKHPDSTIPSPIIKLSTKLLASKNMAQAQNCYDKIATMLEGHVSKLEIEAEEAKRIKKLEEKEKINSMIGMLIASTFEEMGYEVSGIEETCYVKNGEIFAQHSEFPDNAIKLTLDKKDNHSIVSEPIQIGSAKEAYESEPKGEAFDKFWCSREQLGEFRKRLKEKNLALSLKPVEANETGSQAQKKLPESIKDKSSYSKKLDRLLKETNKPRQRTR